MNFMISFDCEGSWGVADNVTHKQFYDCKASDLQGLYEFILKELRSRNLVATFAFVEALVQFDEELFEIFERDYLTHPYFAMLPTKFWMEKGWSLDMSDLDLSGHEIASHSLFHVPYNQLSTSLIEQELLQIKKRNYTSIVFPRNIFPVLSDTLDFNYRPSSDEYQRKLFTRILQELSIVPRYYTSVNGINSGIFLNWQHSWRRFIPTALTLANYSKVIERMNDTDETFHLWLHPENLLNSKSTVDLFLKTLDLITDNCEEKGAKILRFCDVNVGGKK